MISFRNMNLLLQLSSFKCVLPAIRMVVFCTAFFHAYFCIFTAISSVTITVKKHHKHKYICMYFLRRENLSGDHYTKQYSRCNERSTATLRKPFYAKKSSCCVTIITNHRSSRPGVFSKKVFLKISIKEI